MCQLELGRKAHISEVAGGEELEHGLQQPRNAGGRRTDPGTLPAKSSLSVDEGDPVPSFDLSFTAPGVWTIDRDWSRQTNFCPPSR